MDMRPGLRLWSWLARRARQRVGARVVLAWDRRAGVALITALSMPVLLMSVAMGVEVSHWSAQQLDLQRTADLAALAGANAYGSALAQGDTAAQAVTAAAAGAADVAELNGAAGGSRSWSPAAKTLTDNQITVLITSGVKNSADPAVQVTVRRAVPLLFAHIAVESAAVSLAARGTAEDTSTMQWSGAQPCVAALQTAAQGGSGITYSGSTTMKAIGCSVRSNADIVETGSGAWNTEGIIAAGTVTIPFWVSNTDNKGATLTPHPSAGTIPDALASNAALNAAFTAAAQSTGPTIACSNEKCGLANGAPDGTYNGSYCVGQGSGTVTCTLQPGSYGSFLVTSGGGYTFNLQPGMYYFNGNIDLTNQTWTNGSAVTVITTGTFNGANQFSLNLSAPDAAQAADTGGIAGIAMAGNTANPITSSTVNHCNTTSVIAVCGDPTVQITGVVYFPNGTFSGQGSTTASSSSCFELFAGSVTLSGDSGYSGTCPSLDAPGFGSFYSAVTSVALVQ